jgi:hypothetical protein
MADRTETNMKVLGGHMVPTALYQQVRRHLEARMHIVVEKKLYTLSEIYGKAHWDLLHSNWVKRVAGRCFAHMVYTWIFPFRFIQFKRYATKRYQLR